MAAKEACQRLLVGVKSVCKIYDVPFQEHLDAVQQSREKITEGADTALCDHPYNTYRIAESGSSDYDRLVLKDMSFLVDLLSVIIYLGTHVQIVCFALQFKTWYELLNVEMDDVVDLTRKEEELMSDDSPTQTTTIFQIDAKDTSLCEGAWHLP